MTNPDSSDDRPSRRIEAPEELESYINSAITAAHLAGYKKDDRVNIILNFYRSHENLICFSKDDSYFVLLVPRNVAREHVWRQENVARLLANEKCVLPEKTIDRPSVAPVNDINAYSLDGKTSTGPIDGSNAKAFMASLLKGIDH